MTIVVIGHGLIGSAAAKYLGRAGREVVLIGPDEPEDRAAHEGVFGSHYDEGRITRQLDADPYWSAVSRASIARYREMEADSGIGFFTECGGLMAGPGDGALVRGVGAVQAAAGIPAARLDAERLAEAFPYLRFAAGEAGFHEARDAGHISPRALVRAQGVLAAQAGVELIRAEVLGLKPEKAGIVVETTEGAIRAGEVLVAAGGFSNMVLPEPLPIRVMARTVAFFEVGAAERARLAGMPTLIHEPEGPGGIYLLPPILYPDGRHYLKIGGDPDDVALESVDAIKAWFRGAGRAEVGAFLEARIRALMPGLQVESIHTQPCVTTFTAEDRPAIRRLGPRISVATAGCGRGAKCSDELGRLAAGVVLGG